MKRALAGMLLVAVAAGGGGAAAQRPLPPSARDTVVYEVAFPEAVHHVARVTVTFRGLAPGRPLVALMARSSTGRYALHEFAKNVYDVSAADSRGRALAFVRPSAYEWDVAGHDGTVRIAYRVFADHADGTYAGIDSTHAHFNMPAAFMFARGLEDRPIRIVFHPVNGWTVATQLVPTGDPDVFAAPDLDYFFDSPTELSRHHVQTFRAGPDGRYTFRVVMHDTVAPEAEARFVGLVRRIVAEEEQVFGELPAFDYGTYTFLMDALPWVYGDGMEHRNSTSITGRGLGTGGVAHEFFHAWNMKRLRDRAIEPFDFERANASGNLWFGEGFTSYYGLLCLTRAGMRGLEDFAAAVGSELSYVSGSPARRFRSAVEMSEYAPFADAAVSIDQTDLPNTFISYYSWGDVIGLGLDLTLRQRFGKSLDDYMRLLWRELGSKQGSPAAGQRPRPLRPYTRADLRRALAQLTGDTGFADDFFRRYVEGREVQDFKPLLAAAGLLLRAAHPQGVALAGIGAAPLRFDSAGATVAGPTAIGSALYEAGMDNGDRLVSLAGEPVTSAGALSSILAGHRPGDRVLFVYDQRGERKSALVALPPDPTLEVVTYERAGLPVTEAMRAFRESWLGSKVQGNRSGGGAR